MPDELKAPALTASAQEIADYLRRIGAEKAGEWVRDNLGRYDRDVLEEVHTLVGAGGDAAYEPVLQEIRDSFQGTDKVRTDAANRAKQEQAASEQLQSQGVDKATADQAAKEQLDEATGLSVPTPDLVKKYTGGLRPTDQQQQDLVSVWNEFNPDEKVDSYDRFVNIIKDRQSDPLAGQIVDAAFTGQDPVTVYEYSYDAPRQDDKGTTTKSLRVSENEFQSMKDLYGKGFGRRDVQKLGYLAAQLGIDQVVGGQPGWQILAAGAAAMGMWNLGDREKQPLKETTSRAGSIVNAEITKENKLTAKEVSKLRNWGVQFKTGLTTYGYNDSVAFISAFDPSLAARVASTKYEKLSADDKRKAYSYMLSGGFSNENLAKLGYGWAAGLDELAVNQTPTADGIATRTMPDPAQLKQATKDLYMTLFRAEPSDAELNKVVGAVTGAIASADNDASDNVVQDVNAQAQIRKQLEADPQYKELYGNKPGGMGEQEYAQQFDAGAASILGNAAADPNNIRSGMRTGDYQTTVGAAAVSKEAQNNSTWLGRLAQAAQLVSAST